MNKQDLEQIKNKLQELREIRFQGCMGITDTDGDRGACFTYRLDPIDNLIEKIDIELQKENVREIAQVHSDINEKLFGYFKL